MAGRLRPFEVVKADSCLAIVHATCRLSSISKTLNASSRCPDSALTIRNIVIPFLLDLRTQPRRYRSTMSMLSLPNPALPSLRTCNTRSSRASITLPPRTQPAIPPTRCSCPHRRVLALEALPPPRIRKAKRLQLLLVLFLRRRPVFGPRHWFAGFVDVAGPSFIGLF